MTPRPRPCTCPECSDPDGAELDLAFPGEGRQLAFALPAHRRRAIPLRPSQKELPA